MKVIVHTTVASGEEQAKLGRPEYSYRFVMREFMPLLQQLGTVIEVTDPVSEVDPIHAQCLQQGQACVFLSFMPPNKTPIGLACPTIPVFAWEYEALPDEGFSGKPRNDWVRVLRHLGAALTHSSFTVRRVHARLDANFPITRIPAPVWDRMQPLRGGHADTVSLPVDGVVIDSAHTDLSAYRMSNIQSALPDALPLPTNRYAHHGEIKLGGVVYTAVFNPHDSRKNWLEMISAFCGAFRDKTDATLLLKLTHHAPEGLIPEMLEAIYKMGPLTCRILLVHAYLSQPQYDALMTATTYAVNTSHGEGQCLPLMEYMSAGKPAVAPRHTSMLDYIDTDCAFVIDSSVEPGTWPHDQRQAFRTLRQRIHYQSLVHAYQCSYYIARHEPDTYAAMSTAAVESLRRYCSMDVLRPRLQQFMHQRVAQAAKNPTDEVSQRHG